MSQPVECTASGRGAVSVLVLEQPEAIERLRLLAPGAVIKAQRPRLCRLSVNSGQGVTEDLDEAIVWQRPDGAIEVHLHGSPVLVERVLGLLGATAESRSEWISGSLCGGLVKARGELERRAAQQLISAPTRRAAYMLLDQANGVLRDELELWLGGSAKERATIAADLHNRGRSARWVFEVPRIVLGGPVNMGKSTLFNLLVGRQRAVVSDEPGTTRDTIEERAHLAGIVVELVDTAGRRKAVGPAAAVEAAGQLQALDAYRDADLVLWIARGERPQFLDPSTRRIEFFGRADQVDSKSGAVTRPLAPLNDPKQALGQIEQALREAFDLPDSDHDAGAPVPFDSASRQLVQALVELPTCPTTQQAVLTALC